MRCFPGGRLFCRGGPHSVGCKARRLPAGGQFQEHVLPYKGHTVQKRVEVMLRWRRKDETPDKSIRAVVVPKTKGPTRVRSTFRRGRVKRRPANPARHTLRRPICSTSPSNKDADSEGGNAASSASRPSVVCLATVRCACASTPIRSIRLAASTTCS